MNESIADLILDDIRAGLKYVDIAARRGVTRYAVRKVAASNGVQRKAPKGEGKRNRPCEGCGVRTQAKGGRCTPCRAPIPEPSADDALPEGRWVPNGRGICVWRGADGRGMLRDIA